MKKQLFLPALFLSACSGGAGSDTDDAGLANQAKALEAKANAEVDEIVNDMNSAVAADEGEGDEAPTTKNKAE